MFQDSSAFELMMEKGAIRAAQRILQRQGQKRLGSPDADTVTALTAIKDLDRLDRLIDAVFTATSWHELLATP